MNDIEQKPMTDQPAQINTQIGEKTEPANLPPSPLGKIWGFLSSRALNLVTLTTFFSVAGYFVVHSYLDKLTGIFTYQVDPVVYITAGVNMVFGVVVGLVLRVAPTQPSAVFAGLVSIPVIGGFVAIVYWLTYRQTKSEERAQQRIDAALKQIQNYGFYLFIGSVAMLAILLGFVYGYYGYEYSPHAIGGGMPASVILVFKPQSDIQIVDLGLPIEMLTGDDGELRSQPVDLLMELSDGLLVRDPQQGIPFVIKNDLLYAVVDAAPRAISPVVTAAPTAVSTVSP